MRVLLGIVQVLQMNIRILSSNAEGLNVMDKQKVVKTFIRSQRIDLVCLLETKV